MKYNLHCGIQRDLYSTSVPKNAPVAIEKHYKVSQNLYGTAWRLTISFCHEMKGMPNSEWLKKSKIGKPQKIPKYSTNWQITSDIFKF